MFQRTQMSRVNSVNQRIAICHSPRLLVAYTTVYMYTVVNVDGQLTQN